MLLVSDIMTPSVLTLTSGTSLKEAAMTLSNMAVSGAPVCDEKGHVVGVFSKSDVTSKLDGGALQDSTPIRELMTSIVFSVRPRDPLMVAIGLMVFKSVHRLMVIDEEDQLVGILTPMDVLKAIVAGKIAATGLKEASAAQGPSEPR